MCLVWERPQGVRGEAWIVSSLGVSAEQAELVLILDSRHLLIGIRSFQVSSAGGAHPVSGGSTCWRGIAVKMLPVSGPS